MPFELDSTGQPELVVEFRIGEFIHLTKTTQPDEDDIVRWETPIYILVRYATWAIAGW